MRSGVAEIEELPDKLALGESVRLVVSDDTPVRLGDTEGLAVDPADVVTDKLPHAEFDTLRVCVNETDCV